MITQYIFVTDCMEQGPIVVKYYPTDKMIGDFFTKPLGGAKFCRFCNILLNCSHDDYRPVNMDKLMDVHHRRVGTSHITSNTNIIRNEPTISTDMGSMTMTADSKECAGKRHNSMWAEIKNAHQSNKKREHEDTTVRARNR